MRKSIWILAAAGAVLMTASQAAAKADVELAGGPPAQGPGPRADAPPMRPDLPAAGPASGLPLGFDGVVCPPDSVAGIARPGQCFAQVNIAPLIETYTEQVLVTPERRETRTIPAVREWVDQPVVAVPGRVERIVVPATYRTVMETVVVSPATVRRDVMPAQYDTVSVQELTAPAHTEWRRSDGYTRAGWTPSYPGGPAATGEIYCLVEVPASYRTVQRPVLRSPERVVETPIPAVTRQVARQVVDQPARTVERTVPPVIRTERVERVVRPERTESYVVPAVYQPATRERAVRPAGVEWREVLCERNASPEVIRRAQNTLNAWGYDAGRPDGTLNGQTRAAIVRFQHAQRLAEGAFTVETARMLGVLPAGA